MVDKLIKRKEAAEMLGISLDTLDHARMEGLITYVQYVENGCVYFTEVGLQEYHIVLHGFCHTTPPAFHQHPQFESGNIPYPP